MNRLAIPLAFMSLALAACNSQADNSAPAPVTQDEADALEDAATMLDEQRMAPAAEEPEAVEGETE